MMLRSFRVARFVMLAILHMAVLPSMAAAQGPPRPAVDIRQMPDMWHSVLPADFNRDGRTDLIAGARSAQGPSRFDRIVVRLGNGNGTFGAAIPNDWIGKPVTTGDFNGDGRVDAVVIGQDGAMAVLAGRGDGTFTRVWPLDPVPEFVFAASADLDGDGRRDLVIANSTTVELHPGRGDFTFGPAVALPNTTHGPRAPTIADFDGDGRRDLAVAQRQASVFVYLNRGSWRFDGREVVVVDEALYDIAATDLNRDGRQDLVVAHTQGENLDWQAGAIDVLLGVGNGTFLRPVRHETRLRGTVTVTTGDFNRDGLTDVAAGNLSWHWDEEGAAYWDSVSIFPGRGDGTLTAPAHFRLDTGATNLSSDWLNKHHALRTADVNGDGHTDLIASPGAIILNRAAAPNRAPVVDAGPDFTMVQGDARTLVAAVTEPDWDWLQYEWRDEAGHWLSDSPSAYYSGTWTGGDGSIIVTVTDARGGVGTDRVEVHMAPGDFVLYDPPDGATYSQGSDIRIRWTTSLNQDLRGFRVRASPDDGRTWQVIPQCDEMAYFERTCVWPNAGPAGNTWRLSIQAFFDHSDVTREVVSGRFRITDPTAPDARIRFLTPQGGEHFASGARIPITWAADPDAPIGHFRISVSPDEFVSSRVLHADVPTGEREFEWVNAGPPGPSWRVRIEAFDFNGRFIGTNTTERFTIDPAAPGAFPWPWEENFDVGTVAATGSASYANGIFTVRGSGADIWGTADAFHQVLTRWNGDFAFTARIRSVENINQWTKVGLMIREDIAAGSPHASVFVTPTTVKGVAFQRRPVRGGSSVHTAGPALTAPIWLKLVRTGKTIRAYYRKQITDRWLLIGRQDFASLPSLVEPMLVVSSHVDGRVATATFDNVSIDTLEPMQSADIGTTTSGSTSTDGVTTTIEGNGADIWGRADAFRFRYTRWAGNGTITARVRSLEQTHVWAKAGVMFRESLAPGSKHVMAIVSPGKGMAVQSRPETGGDSVSSATRAGTAPVWIRLTREGDLFTAFTSNDGVTWTRLALASVAMNAEILVGLPVTSHSAGTLATAVFDDVVIERQ